MNWASGEWAFFFFGDTFIQMSQEWEQFSECQNTPQGESGKRRRNSSRFEIICNGNGCWKIEKEETVRKRIWKNICSIIEQAVAAVSWFLSLSQFHYLSWWHLQGWMSLWSHARPFFFSFPSPFFPPARICHLFISGHLTFVHDNYSLLSFFFSSIFIFFSSSPSSYFPSYHLTFVFHISEMVMGVFLREFLFCEFVHL